ncbi:GDP-mannose-dependent alpha-(1-6)-phosphatidylinositol monomannoside mannosyltransferase [Falsiruegeria litorea R37]|uniref:GDP-mannose-dependent alpha-(1-6)-phosphatidylinositol monomannoside mannosyltransferase n=1 Tax=Falsiruegeria litorea R37 TaxID=1200284 RepID=A0A1Y5U1F2_9RHOB|nr:glycosyltransferase family 4 protein [Falsiruegeria litorea]SLN74450.1 GDP-mannose-dependent alpha-(1-6)-phosphatidylinositol monomannoside mannosyltransferase [Falsiruegeria litorea R37]
MQIYAFVPDAFGGHGGISVFNKDLLIAFAQHSRVDRVVALPRVMRHTPEPIPEGIVFRSGAVNSTFAYMKALARDLPDVARSDMLYCGHLNYAPLVSRLGRLFGIPVLGALYGIDAWTPSPKAARRRAASRLDRYYSISAYTRDRFLEWADVDTATIDLLPNAIHMSDYAPAPRDPALMARYGLTPENKVLLTFGRLVSRERAKGFDEVLDVLPRLLQDMPELRYIIAGDGPDQDRLEARVTEAGLGNAVIFTGYVEEAEKAALYGLSDLYVMPSRGEGFGFVFLEALACGVPVVASAIDGSRDAVRDGLLGPMVNPDDPEELIGAIRTGLSSPKGMMPEALAYFDFPQFAQRAQALIDETVAP